VASQPDVVLSSTTSTTEALLQQTRSIPIIFGTVADPVGSGFVASLPRPGLRPLLAPLRHAAGLGECLFIGADRKSSASPQNDVIDQSGH
jgi:hypothetical protein